MDIQNTQLDSLASISESKVVEIREKIVVMRWMKMKKHEGSWKNEGVYCDFEDYFFLMIFQLEEEGQEGKKRSGRGEDKYYCCCSFLMVHRAEVNCLYLFLVNMLKENRIKEREKEKIAVKYH